MNKEFPTNVPAPVQEHFSHVSNRWAGRYKSCPRGMSDLDLILRRENAQSFLHEIIRGSDRKLEVVDIGCGTGDGLDGISRDQISVLGVDAVPEMIEVAKRNHPQDRFIRAELEDIPVEDCSADVILCLGVLEYVDDPDVALRSTFRILKPGGHLIISFPNKKSLFRKLSKFLVAFEEALSNILRKIRSANQSVNPEARYKHTRWSPNVAEELLARNKFINPRFAFNTFGIWGRIGRLRIARRVSAWLSDVFRESKIVGKWFACTMVVQVEKPMTQ